MATPEPVDRSPADKERSEARLGVAMFTVLPTPASQTLGMNLYKVFRFPWSFWDEAL